LKIKRKAVKRKVVKLTKVVWAKTRQNNKKTNPNRYNLMINLKKLKYGEK
jgi:hypothetical protein